MSQKRAKIHHYVPKALQRYFCARSDQIWFSERLSKGTNSFPELRNIDSTFKMRDYYTVLDGNALSDKVEVRFYQQLDDYLAKFLSEISDIFDDNKVPHVTGDQLDSFQKLIFQLIKRVPDFMKKYDDIEIGRDVLEKTLTAVLKAGDPDNEEALMRTQLEDEKELKRVGRHVRVEAQISRSDLVEQALEGFQIKWGRLKIATHLFCRVRLFIGLAMVNRMESRSRIWRCGCLYRQSVF